MIKLTEIENINLSNSSVVCKLFDQSSNIIEILRVPNMFITGNDIDIVGLLSENGYLNSVDEYQVQIEVLSDISKNIVYDVNRAKNEFLLSTKELNELNLKSISEYNDKAIFVFHGGLESVITDVEVYDNNIVIATENPISSINVSTEISIFEKLYVSDMENFTFVFEEEVRPRVFLEGHTKKDLVNFDIDGRSSSTVKSFDDLITENSSINVNDIISFYDNINIDYSDFSNHTRFSSAHSKIINIENKISDVEDIKSKIENNDGKIVENKLRNEVEKIFGNFTPYEKYVFSEVYSKMTTTEFNDWIVEKKEEAELYDLQNDEFIMFLFPPDIVESDDSGYFTNFLLLMGEFFDQIWLYIESLSNINERSFHSDYQISSQFVTDVLSDMGINKNVSYTDENVLEYFGGEDNFNKISTILSKRLLYDLSFLYKTKGTEKVVREVLNIFGVPRGFLDIYKFSNSTEKSEEEIKSVEYDWALAKNSDDVTTINIADTDMGTDVTFEMVIKNFQDSGRLLSIDANNYVTYSVTNNVLTLSIFDGGVEVTNSINIPFDPDNWSYIAMTSNNGSGNIYFWQQDRTGFGIVNEYTTSISWDTALDGTYTSIEVLEDTQSDITEFRVYNSVLSAEDAKIHAMDIRSTAEEVSSIISRIKFYKPDSDFSQLEAREGSFVLSMVGVVEGDFYTDEFFNFNIINYIFGEDFNVNDIRIDELNNEISALGRTFRSEYKYGNEEDMNDIVGVFLSPSKKANVDIIRRFGNFIEYIPSEFDENKTFFENLEEHEDKINPKLYNEAVYNTIFRVINNRIFDILKLFVPVSSDFEYGYLIKNHIFKKNRGYIHTKEGEGSIGYELSLKRDDKVDRYESDDNHSINIISVFNAPNIFSDRNAFDENLTLKAYEGDSVFGLSIKNDTTTSFSEFYSQKIISGMKPSAPSDEEISIIENSGASIIVV